MAASILKAIARERSGGRIELAAPAVGLWRSAPGAGAVVPVGGTVGELEVLGVVHRLIAPSGGAVVEGPEGPPRARRPVAYGERLLLLDPNASGVVASAARPAASEASSAEEAALVFRAPSSGRFYSRPSPSEPSFVSPGDEIALGQTVCLLEVMKTFNRIVYGGDDMPPEARVTRVVPEDGADLDAGDVILELA